MQAKISDKQYQLLIKLYKEQGKIVTPNVENWLTNLPAIEAGKYIDKWIANNKKRKDNARNWYKQSS